MLQEQLPLLSTCGPSQHYLRSVNHKCMRRESRSDTSPFLITEELRGITAERVFMQQTNFLLQEASDLCIFQE